MFPYLYSSAFTVKTQFSKPRVSPRGTHPSLRVYVCPTPEAVQAAAATAADSHAPADVSDRGVQGEGGGGLVLVSAEPVLHATLKWAELTCLDWSPHDPTLLLAGASDGTD